MIPGQPGIFFVLKTRIALLLFILLFFISFFIFDLGQYLNLTYLKSNQKYLIEYYSNNQLFVLFSFFFIYILTTALSIPGATILTLAGAGIFGFWTSIVLISLASTIGATLSFLGSRFLFKDFIQDKFQERLVKVNQGIEREGTFYLFTMRLIPVIPFFMINLLMGLTPIKATKYFWVSLVGMLPGSLLYVNAGVQLSEIETTSDIISPDIIVSLILLGVFPLAVKKGLDWYKNRS